MRTISIVAAVIMTAVLGGCAGTQMPETAVVSSAPTLADCRQTAPLFESFSLAAKKIDWKGQKVTITFVITNTSNGPAAPISPAYGAAVSFPSMNLVNASGITFMDDNNNPLMSLGFLNPGIRKEFSIGFEVPPGPYTLVIGRETGAGGVIVQHPDVFRCSLRA